MPGRRARRTASPSGPLWKQLRDHQAMTYDKLKFSLGNLLSFIGIEVGYIPDPETAAGGIPRNKSLDSHGGGGSVAGGGEFVGPLCNPPRAVPISTWSGSTPPPGGASSGVGASAGSAAPLAASASFPSCPSFGEMSENGTGDGGLFGTQRGELYRFRVMVTLLLKHLVFTIVYTTLVILFTGVRWWLWCLVLPLRIPGLIIDGIYSWVMSIAFSFPVETKGQQLLKRLSHRGAGNNNPPCYFNSKDLYRGSTGPKADQRKNFLNFIVPDYTSSASPTTSGGANTTSRSASFAVSNHSHLGSDSASQVGDVFPHPPNTAGPVAHNTGLSHHHKDPGFGGNLSTILSALRPYIPSTYYRQYIRAIDGGTHCVDWLFATTEEAKGIVGLVPGLTSSSDTFYVETMARVLAKEGYHVAVLNARGMGTTPLTSPRLTCGTSSDDVRTMIRRAFDKTRLERDFGIPETCSKKLFLVGWSLGGAMLAKLLGEEGRDHTPLNKNITAAAACCAPWDFHESQAQLEETLCGRYFWRYIMANGCKEYLNRHLDMIQRIPEIDLEKLQHETHTISQVDDHCVSTHFGYTNRFEYYTAASSMPQFLEKVQVPMLCFTAIDDPVTGKPPRDQRWKDVVESNPNINYVSSPVGGHLAFMDGFSVEVISPWFRLFGVDTTTTKVHSQVSEGNFLERFVTEYINQAERCTPCSE